MANAVTIVQLLMARDGLVDTEAQEVAQEIYTRVVAGENANDVLPDYGIDPRELGLQPVNFEL